MFMYKLPVTKITAEDGRFFGGSICLSTAKFQIIATLGLHLGFSAKLRIWQVSACKMEPRSGIISWFGPPTHPPPTHS